MFKVNNENSRTTSMTYLLLILNTFHISHFSNVSIVDFEQLNVSWVVSCGSEFLVSQSKNVILFNCRDDSATTGSLPKVFTCQYFHILDVPLHASSSSLCEKCPYSEFFWSVFSHIRTGHGEIRSISPYSVRMRGTMDQKNSKYGHFTE